MKGGCSLSPFFGPLGSRQSKSTLQHYLGIFFIGRMIQVLLHIDLTLTVVTVTENGRQSRLK